MILSPRLTRAGIKPGTVPAEGRDSRSHVSLPVFCFPSLYIILRDMDGPTHVADDASAREDRQQGDRQPWLRIIVFQPTLFDFYHTRMRRSGVCS